MRRPVDIGYLDPSTLRRASYDKLFAHGGLLRQTIEGRIIQCQGAVKVSLRKKP
jgi:hypothetical protein